MSKQAKVDVIVNSEQAKARLKELQDHLDLIKQKRIKAMEEGNSAAVKLYNAELTKTGNEIDKIEKQWTDVDGVLRNMSGSTIRELKTAHSQMRKELESMSRTDPEYASKAAQVKLLKNEIDIASGSMGKQGITLKGLMSTVGGWAAGLGLATSALEIVRGAISSSEAISDKWERTTMGLKTAWNVFLNTLATGNWSGFIDRLNDAVKAGQNYADMLDLLEDRQRGLSVRHAQAEEEISKLTLSFYDNNKSAKEKAAVQQEIIDKTTKMREEDALYAKQNYETTAQYLADSKKINKQVLEDWLIFSGGTEKKAQMLQSYSDAFTFLKHNKLLLGENNKLVIEAQKTIKEGNAAGLFQFKQLTEALSPEEIKNATDLYIEISKANAEVNNDVIANKRKLEMQLNKEEKAVKSNAKVIREATKTLSQLITEKDAEIDAAIQSGNLPLAEKLQIEKKAMEDLAATYKVVKEEIAKGWDINQRDQGDIVKLVSIGVKGIKSDSPGTGLLVKRNTGITPGPSEDIIDGENKQKDLNNQIKEAAYATATETNNAVFDIVRNRQQAEFDNKIGILEKEKEAIINNEKLTDAVKLDLLEKNHKKQAALKTANFKKEQNASAIQALINGALGITKTFAVMGFTPPAWVAAAALAASTLIEVIAIKSAKPPEYYEGGFTDQDINDRKPAGIVHANEFIGAADAVRNPTVKPYFDVIDYAQRNGTISQISLPPINVPGKREFRSGGYATGTMIDPTKISQPGSTASNQLSNEALSITREIAKQIALEFKDGIKGKWVLNDLEKIQKDKRNIESLTDM